MRRAEFEAEEIPVIHEILDRASYGHLAILDEGFPRALPLNFVRHDQHLYFHGTPAGMLVEQVGRSVSYTVQDMASWIPSTWRHPHNACPATTFYRSAMVMGELEAVENLLLKATILEAFMAKYQPEGGHRAIDAHARTYKGPLEALAVSRLSLERAVAKVKMGQNLTPDQRRRVYDGLLKRARPEDRWVALEMQRLDPSLRAAEAQGALNWVDDPRRIPLDQLQALLNGTYWAASRPRYEIARHLRESVLTLAALNGDKLVAYARVGTPGPNVGYLFDVVVEPDFRGRGVGVELVRRVLDHPSVAGLPRIMLDTRDAMSLYGRFGFRELTRTDRNGGSSLMIGGAGVGNEVPARRGEV